ncbi:MAG TPA: ABC transporter permease subunit [Kofleriaceae bacterium]|nr:ABC transporter permease subunit [Kofleriaceae bacterium]
MADPSETVKDSGSSPPTGGRIRWPLVRSSSAVSLLIKFLLLGTVAAIALYGVFPLIQTRSWAALALLIAATALLFVIYLSPRFIPAKYLIPGTLFLLAFQVLPVLYTVATAFTNFGDGHRGSKQDAVRAIESSSIIKVAGSAQFLLSVAVDEKASPATGTITFLLSDAATHKLWAGKADGLAPLAAADATVSPAGKITAAKGYTVLTVGQTAGRGEAVAALRVPTEKGAIRSQGLSRAYEGAAQLAYDAGCDCIRDAKSGATWKADRGDGYFHDASGGYLAQGWRVSVGFRNFVTVITNPVVSRYFFQILLWNFAFALLTVVLSFAFGLGMALVFNSERLRGQRLYRSLLILPYAMPSFAMLLVWRDMFNTDFGLINRLFGLDVNWFGTPWSARAAIIMVQIWLSYPYMFLVSTGALQAIPADLTEAAQVDGAKTFHAFRTITFPLLLVALAPLLISSFAFNFNNFNAIYLTSEGGPFPPDNPQVGATDLLITYTYRLAFGGQGAQYGMAAAISIFIFLIVAMVSVVGFRRAQVLEEIN